MDFSNKIKKFLMRQMYRLQQTQAIISIVFWSLALTGIFYERANFYLHKYLGLDEDENKQVITKMAVLFAIVVIGVLAFGFLYDAIFRMWEHTNVVMQERNPYTIYKFNSYQVNMTRHLWIPTLKAANTDGRYDRDIEFMERWLEKVLNTDPVLKHHVNHVENWVLSDETQWKHIDERQIMKLNKEGEGNGD